MELDDITNRGNDWEVLLTFFPEGWQFKAKEPGGLRRCRKFTESDALVRTLLIHLADGCSLRETAVKASAGKLCWTPPSSRRPFCGEQHRLFEHRLRRLLLLVGQAAVPSLGV